MPKRLEEYLNQLRFEMKAMPEDKREAEIEEIREHLEALVGDFRYWGDSEEVALAKAFQRFGSSRATGKGLSQAWRRENRWQRKPLALWRSGFLSSLAILGLMVVLGSLRGSSHDASYPSAASRDSVLYAIESQHQNEVAAIQKRWQADNLALQKMSQGSSAALRQAQLDASSRFQSEMNMANYRRRTNIKTFQRQTVLTFVVLPLLGMALLMVGMIVIAFRYRASQNFKRARMT